MTIRLYTSDNCKPCERVRRLLEEGRFTGEDIEIIDVETDEGFALFRKEVLEHEEGAVPSAYKEGKRCQIRLDEDEKLIIQCPEEASHPLSEET